MNTKPVEFSKFYKLLNAVKEGEGEKKVELEEILIAYKDSEHSESALHQLGEKFIYIGIMKLYEYSEHDNIEAIGNISKEEWKEMAEDKKAELPPFLANAMLNYAKEEGLSDIISKRWNTTKREIDKNLMQMARYITEGIIDSIE